MDKKLGHSRSTGALNERLGKPNLHKDSKGVLRDDRGILY